MKTLILQQPQVPDYMPEPDYCPHCGGDGKLYYKGVNEVDHRISRDEFLKLKASGSRGLNDEFCPVCHGEGVIE